MNRRFLRPLFSFWDPFFSEPIYIKRVQPGGSRAQRAVQNQEKKQIYDANQTFDNFFKDYYDNSSSLKAEEKQFFEKHYPERIGKKFNPYEVLGLEANSDIEKVKQAYRTNAIKYHPKNDASSEAKQKFQDLSRAYNQIVHQKQTNDYGEDVSAKSLFEDFNRQMQNLGKSEAEPKGNQKITEAKTEANGKQQSKTNVKTQDKKSETAQKKSSQVKTQKQSKDNNILKGAELYSQTSYFEYINGKKKLHVTKMYEKNGKTIKVDRIEQNRNDGSIQVSQTYDDGKEVRNKKYVQAANKKIKYLN